MCDSTGGSYAKESAHCCVREVITLWCSELLKGLSDFSTKQYMYTRIELRASK